MSTATVSVYPTRRRRPAGDQVPGDRPGPVSIDELLCLAMTRAVDLVDQATDHSLSAIRARGVGPDEDQVAPVDEIPY